MSGVIVERSRISRVLGVPVKVTVGRDLTDGTRWFVDIAYGPTHRLAGQSIRRRYGRPS